MTGLVSYEIAIGARSSIWNPAEERDTVKTYVMWRFSGRISIGTLPIEDMLWPVIVYFQRQYINHIIIWMHNPIVQNYKKCIIFLKWLFYLTLSVWQYFSVKFILWVILSYVFHWPSSVDLSEVSIFIFSLFCHFVFVFFECLIMNNVSKYFVVWWWSSFFADILIWGFNRCSIRRVEMQSWSSMMSCREDLRPWYPIRCQIR